MVFAYQEKMGTNNRCSITVHAILLHDVQCYVDAFIRKHRTFYLADCHDASK